MAADIHVPAAADLPAQPEPLDGFKRVAELRERIDELNEAVSDPAVFFQPQPSLIQAVRDAAKVLFKHTSTAAVQSSNFSLPLQELYVDGFDAEQIWLQLELQTEPVLKRARRLLKAAGTAPTIVTKAVEKQVDALINGESEEEDGAEDEDESEGREDRSDDEDESDGEGLDEDEDGLDGVRGRKKRRRGLREENGGMGESDEDMDEDGLPDEDEEEEEEELQPKKKKKGAKAAGRLSGVEDKFLSFGDMEKFLEASEKAAAGLDDGDDDGLSGEEDEDEDGMLDEEDGDEEEEEDIKKSKRRKPSIFDDDTEYDEDREGDGEEEDEDDELAGMEAGEGAQAKKKLMSLLGNDAEVDDDENGEPLSKHERHMKRVQAQVKQLEERALAEKPWQLKGEVSAADRPLNSALEVYMDIDTRAAPPPAPTEEQGLELEDIIKKRIVERRFDDPVRILPPEPPKKKKEVELDDKKSGKGLAELYEEDYVQAVSGVTASDKDDPIREEAKALFKLLCAKLDALSHFHYAPKPVVEEMVVRSDVAALAMEEVAPLVVSTEALQAPMEAHKPEADGAPQAEGELTREDRKRRRAAKKRAGKARKAQKDADRKAKGLAPLSQGNVVAGVAPVKTVESSGRQKKSEFRSSAVFARIQDQQNSGLAGAGKKKKDATEGKSSAAFKL